MSFSEPRLENPAKRFIDFKDGQFQYYDKEEEKNVPLDLPLYFVVLDELSCIGGYSEKHKCGIYSNEVHRISDEILRVRTFKGGESIIGLYKDISDAVARIGGKFTKSVYAMLITQDEEGYQYELVNFRFKGAAFAGWLDKKFNPEKFVVGVKETREETKGRNTYQVPVFKAFKLSDEFIKNAVEMDRDLQKYLKAYKEKQVVEEISETVLSDDDMPEEINEDEELEILDAPVPEKKDDFQETHKTKESKPKMTREAKEEFKGTKCLFGHKYGVDAGDFEECELCPDWAECSLQKKKNVK